MTGQMNPDAKAVFLASLEYGVSPLMPNDLYGVETTWCCEPKREGCIHLLPPNPEQLAAFNKAMDAADARAAEEAYAEYIASGRKSRPWREFAAELGRTS